MAKMLDRQFKGIGRIQKSYGTDDAATQHAISAMLTTLYRTGRHEFLEAVRDNKTSLLELYAKFQSQRLHDVAVVEGVIDFDPTVYSWVADYPDIADSTRKNYTHHFKTLQGIKKNFPLTQLPDVLNQYKKVCVRNETGRQFNMVRNTVSSFLNSQYGTNNPVYKAVREIKPLSEKKKNPGVAHPVHVALAVRRALRNDLGDMWWTMCICGVGMDEYRKGLTIEGHGIRIKGEKMKRVDERRNRLVPYIQDPAPIALEQKQFRKHLKNASPDGTSVKIYDGRRTFSLWCQEAGIPFARVQMYMGHSSRTMTDRYTKSQMDAFLKEDGDKLRQYIDKKTKEVMTPEHQALVNEFFDFRK